MLESEAILAILAFCEQGNAELISSDVVDFEISNTPNPQRRAVVLETIKKSTETVTFSAEIQRRAKQFEQKGVKAIDALHLASAEQAQVDFFCTCDDRFYRRARGIADLTIQVKLPLELAQEILL
jgi:hypothetical protein